MNEKTGFIAYGGSRRPNGPALLGCDYGNIPCESLHEGRLLDHPIEPFKTPIRGFQSRALGNNLFPIPLLVRIDAFDQVEAKEDPQRRQPEGIINGFGEERLYKLRDPYFQRNLVISPDLLRDAPVDVNDRIVPERIPEAGFAARFEH